MSLFCISRRIGNLKLFSVHTDALNFCDLKFNLWKLDPLPKIAVPAKFEMQDRDYSFGSLLFDIDNECE